MANHLAKYQCQKCRINAYYNGKCYADRQKGRTIKDYGSCTYAAPKKVYKKRSKPGNNIGEGCTE